MAVVDGALTARARKRLDKRNAQQAEETEKWFKKLPEPAEADLKKQILTECYDAVYLWVWRGEPCRIIARRPVKRLESAFGSSEQHCSRNGTTRGRPCGGRDGRPRP